MNTHKSNGRNIIYRGARALAVKTPLAVNYNTGSVGNPRFNWGSPNVDRGDVWDARTERFARTRAETIFVHFPISGRFPDTTPHLQVKKRSFR